MRAHWFQHVPFEGLGSIEPWLVSNGYTVTCTRFFESVVCPEPEDVDFLVIMGGPMSVNDESDYPWLVPEKQFLRAYLRSGKPALGICLGAQMIATVAGANVYRNPVKEIGWFPVQAVSSGTDALFSFPPSMTVFHWHGETFDLPPGAARLARSEGCENQAFQLGEKVIGLQFHLETTPLAAAAIIENCRNELVPGRYVQSAADLRSIGVHQYELVNRVMDRILAFLCNASGCSSNHSSHRITW
jgi:GMP synthase-like glutamine amidotransferase